jgi:RNA polymerase sigma-70 factor (ECF subfamily)
MDPGDFERVVMEQKDRIFGFATRMLRDSGEAQDVAQESLIRLWGHRDTIDLAGAPRWLHRTVHNLCIDRIRRRRSRPETGVGETGETIADAAAGPDRRVRAGEVGAALVRELGALSEGERAVILLREVEGLGYDEIAQILDVPLGTLKARLHRAREHLRARLLRAGVAP